MIIYDNYMAKSLVEHTPLYLVCLLCIPRWTDFVELLEKVQPHATGLPIPQSKRPLEYARKYRQPTENWPHPNPAALEPAARIPLMTMREEEQQQQQVLSQLQLTLG